MRVLHNPRPGFARRSLGAALLLLGVAAFVLFSLGGRNAGTANEADAWGPDRDGLRTRLVPDQKEYVIGQPAKFRLEMKNFGEHNRMFDSQGVGVNGSIRISGPDGKPVPYVGGGFQTSGGARPIAPGETVVLFEGHDLTNQYLFVKPGSYALQYRDKWVPVIPGSNTISIKMRPGTLPMSMQVPARLIEILPKKWSMGLNMRVAEVDRDGKIAPPGWESDPGTYLALVHDWNMERSLLVPVWVAEHRLARKGTHGTGGASKPGEVAEYLGKGADGHVYWVLEGWVDKEWPDIRTKVKAALRIEPLAQEPGALK